MSKFRVKKDSVSDIWYLQEKILNEKYKGQWVIIGHYRSRDEAHKYLNEIGDE